MSGYKDWRSQLADAEARLFPVKREPHRIHVKVTGKQRAHLPSYSENGHTERHEDKTGECPDCHQRIPIIHGGMIETHGCDARFAVKGTVG